MLLCCFCLQARVENPEEGSEDIDVAIGRTEHLHLYCDQNKAIRTTRNTMQRQIDDASLSYIRILATSHNSGQRHASNRLQSLVATLRVEEVRTRAGMFALTHKRRSTVAVPIGNVSYTHGLHDVDATNHATHHAANTTNADAG
jgi:hypothetical protein